MHIRSQKGFSAAELLVVIAIIGIMAAIAIPSMLAYWPTATVQGAARDLQGGLTRAKTLAITTRQNICVEVLAGGYRFRQGGCGGGAWVGAGTSATGLFSAPENVTFTSPANPIFTQFGTASQTAILTVTGPSNRTLTVTVLPSGWVRIP
ncbi:MAG: prepilin-type N-terminal cleavage/methylation domain-containing protein [Candidatus Rokuibacteriota bacterium]